MTPAPHELKWARAILAMDEWDLGKLGYREAQRTARWVLASEERPYPLSATEEEAAAWLAEIRRTLEGRTTDSPAHVSVHTAPASQEWDIG